MVQAADATAYGDINPQSVSDEDIGDQIIIAAGVFIALQTIFVVLRFVARLIGKSRFGIDDWFIIPSWLSGIGLCVCSICRFADKLVTK